MTQPNLAFVGRWGGQPVLVDLGKPDLSHVPWDLLCQALAHINRFNGCTTPCISVAGHSIRVAKALPQHLQAYGALHDMHEALMGDPTRPVRRQLAWHGPASTIGLETLEASLQAAVFAKAHLPWPLPAPDMALLQAADDAAGALELECAKQGIISERMALDTITPHPRIFMEFVTSVLRVHHVLADRRMALRAKQLQGAA